MLKENSMQKIKTKISFLTLLIPVAREDVLGGRTGFSGANRIGRNKCALELPGCKDVGPSNPMGSCREKHSSVPKKSPELWKVFLVAWRCRLCKTSQLGPSKGWVNWSRKFGVEELCSLCLSQGYATSASLNTVWELCSCTYLAKTKEKELCLKKCWYFVCSFRRSSLPSAVKIPSLDTKWKRQQYAKIRRKISMWTVLDSLAFTNACLNLFWIPSLVLGVQKLFFFKASFYMGFLMPLTENNLTLFRSVISPG